MREKPKPEKWKFYCYVICSYFLFTVNLSSIMNCFYSCTMQNLYLNYIDLNHCYIALTCRISHVRILGTFLRESKKLATKAIGSTKTGPSSFNSRAPVIAFRSRTNEYRFVYYTYIIFIRGWTCNFCRRYLPVFYIYKHMTYCPIRVNRVLFTNFLSFWKFILLKKRKRLFALDRRHLVAVVYAVRRKLTHIYYWWLFVERCFSIQSEWAKSTFTERK